MELTEPLDVAAVTAAQVADAPMPKRVSLPSMLPPGCAPAPVRDRVDVRPGGRLLRHAPRLEGVDRGHHGHEDDHHHREDRPALSGVAHHLAEGVGEAAGMRRMASSSTKLENGVGFSNGCDELALKKPPPLVPSCLMATCEAAGPTTGLWRGDGRAVRVGRRLQEGGLLGVVEGLHHALRHEDDGEDDRQRQQDVEHRAGHVHPEVAERAGEPAREAADEGHRHGHAGRRRDEVLHRQPDHLGDVLHGASRPRRPASWCW